MKNKTKIFGTVLLCCALVAVLTACAGCTSTEPIVGAWKCDKSVALITYIDYYEFNSDGTSTYTLRFGNMVTKLNPKWVKVGDNHYQMPSGDFDYYLNSDATQLTVIWYSDSTKHEDVYTRISASEIPAETKTTSLPTVKSTTSATIKPTSAPQSSATLGEKNALQSAKSYLKLGGFSESGLKDQLDYEGYLSSEITYAIKNCGANWNDQALQSAKSYLKLGGFSESGLKDQLDYEGFTSSQISYAIKNCGANWNDQALQSAKSYLKLGGFSKSRLKEQLDYEGFTASQISYALSAVGY